MQGKEKSMKSRSFQSMFSTGQINMVYQELEVAYLRILFKADYKNKNRFLYMQVMQQVF